MFAIPNGGKRSERLGTERLCSCFLMRSESCAPVTSGSERELLERIKTSVTEPTIDLISTVL
jgi:hypothetical protein